MYRVTERFVGATLAVVVLGTCAAGRAAASLITLSDRNSTLKVDTGSSAGVYEWQVDGVNQVAQQWFWYRVGSAGGEYAINTLVQKAVKASDTNADPGDDVLFITYGDANGTFEIDVKYSLQGGQAGTFRSDLGEQVAIRNIGSSTLSFHLFQYSDFNLNGSGQGQTVLLTPTGGPQRATQTGNGLMMSETVVTPAPSLWEANVYAVTLDKLNNVTDITTNLNGQLSASGDVTWAFQWDFSLEPGKTYLISKDKSITVVPEPCTALLSGIAFALVGWGRRRLL